jgi:urease accessory protein
MNQVKNFQLVHAKNVALVSLATLLSASSALAHHPLGGKIPSNFFEGFMSGLAHPVIAPGHLAVIIAVGLLAATQRQGVLFPIAFLLSAMMGTLAHLAGVSIPGVDMLVATSILGFGALLVMKNSPNLWLIVGGATIAGLFHGYAYGEAIFGAGMTPVMAYLSGFTLIQMVIAFAALTIARKFCQPQQLRSAGLVIAGVGLAFFTSQVISAIFPAA